MATPQFFVVARVVGSAGAFAKWEERLVPLCGVSATEPQGTSYYWAQDLDGEPDTLWGLEGYTHAVGFFLGHPSSDIFKEQMALVDEDKLLKTQQGLGSPDYDLHYYDFDSGYLTLSSDKDKDSTTGHVAIEHFWVTEGKRGKLLESLRALAESTEAEAKDTAKVQSCAVLKECVFSSGNMATLWTRTKTPEDYKTFQSSSAYRKLRSLLEPILEKTELHQARAFNGHIDKEASFKG